MGHRDKPLIEVRRHLQDSFSKRKCQKYEKYTQLLKEKNYKFPSELLSSYGVIKLNDELQKLRSVGIPDILSNGLHFALSEKETTNFHRIRGFRNDIAHGRRNDFTVSSAMECNRFLRELAVRIDNHIVTNFFVIEAYS